MFLAQICETSFQFEGCEILEWNTYGVVEIVISLDMHLDTLVRFLRFLGCG